MSSQNNASTPLEQALHIFTSDGLASPPIPREFHDRLKEIRENLHASTDIDVGPYNIDHYTSAVGNSGMDESYVLAGIDGRGINSWAVHYYLVQPGLALFIQKAWGGAYVDEERARSEIADAFHWAGEVQKRIDGLQRIGRIKPGFHLVLQLSDFAGSQWAPIPFANFRSSSGDETPVDWTLLRDYRKETAAVFDRIEAGELS